MNINRIYEIQLQKAVQVLLSKGISKMNCSVYPFAEASSGSDIADSKHTGHTFSSPTAQGIASKRKSPQNKNIQILSPGTINVHEGPDFKNFSYLLNGKIHIGDAEFHKKSSHWFEHNHDSDPNYSNVIMHIVLEHDLPNALLGLDTLVLDSREVFNVHKQQFKPAAKSSSISYDDLQGYSLTRLELKIGRVKELLSENSIEETVRIVLGRFLKRYQSKRRRAIYYQSRLENIFNRTSPRWINFLEDLSLCQLDDISCRMDSFFNQKFSSEGSSLRAEMIINCLVPLSIAIANKHDKTQLYNWYWTVKSQNNYGILNRRFKDYSQEFFWQQQGMLEFLKSYK